MKKNVRSFRLDDAACEKLTQDAKMNHMSDAEYINDLIHVKNHVRSQRSDKALIYAYVHNSGDGDSR